MEAVDFVVLAGKDGRIVDPAPALPEHLRDLLTGEDARVRRREAIDDGPVTYVATIADERWRITVAHRPSAEADQFRYRVQRAAEPAPSAPITPGAVTPSVDILDILPYVIVMTDMGGDIVYANRSGVEMVGAESMEALLGRPVWSFVHPEDISSARRAGLLLEGGKQVEYVRHRIVRLDGRAVPVEIVTRRTEYQGRTVILISAHDLTGLRTMEQALEESQQLFYRVFKTGPLAIAVARLADATTVDANDAFCELVGTPRERLIDRHPREVGVQWEAGQYEALVKAVETHGSVQELELQLQMADGSVRTLLTSASRIDVRGEPCLLMMATDITERKQSSLILKESEERFRTLADSAPVHIWLADPDRRRTYVNARWTGFTGRSMAEEVRDGWLENVHPDDVDSVVRTYADAYGKREPFSIEYRLRRHDGVYRWMLDRGVPRYLPDGTFVGYIGSCVDITDRKLAEQKLLLSKQQAEKMTILRSAFLANMTHEIRTPLTVILGFTSILKQGTRREYQRFVHLIERSGRRLLLMLDSVLDLAQLEAGTLTVELSRHNVVDITHGVIASLRQIAEEKDLYLDFTEPGGAAYAYVDSAVLSRVLNNLLDNAIKFTETGGVRVWIEEDASSVMVHIDDTGVGIGSEFLPHVFEAFTQESTGIERTHQGSGLGLTVSKQLLDLLGGDLLLTSRKGSGSAVTICLPKSA